LTIVVSEKPLGERWSHEEGKSVAGLGDYLDWAGSYLGATEWRTEAEIALPRPLPRWVSACIGADVVAEMSVDNSTSSVDFTLPERCLREVPMHVQVEVVDDMTSLGIAGARVDLGLPGVDELSFETTSPGGYVFLPRVRAGERELVIVADGYVTLRERVVLDPRAQPFVRIGERRLVRESDDR
jgi:hypothetical protein